MSKFSVTDRRTFRRCRRQWDFSSNARQNLTGVGAGPEQLELGSLIHRALADWILHYSQEPKEATVKGYLLALFLEHTTRRQEEIKASFTEKHGYEPTKQMLVPLLNVTSLGMNMMMNYQEHHKTPIPSNMTFASPEQEVEIPVPGTEHPCITCFGSGLISQVETYLDKDGVIRHKVDKCLECEGRGKQFHYLTATLDGLLQDRNNKLYVLEHKTYENRPQYQALTMDDQFSGYAWVVRKLNIGTVGGVAYDGMWKREKPPEKGLKDQSTGKWRKATLDDLFIRKTIQKSDMLLDAWEENLTNEILDMAQDPSIYPNVPWQGCLSDCAFVEPCTMLMNGEDPSRLIEVKYVQREIVRGGVEKE